MTHSGSNLPADVPSAEARPEIQLLLCCARMYIDPVRSARIRALLRETLDWEYLIGTALQHRVMPLLYWNLHATCPEAVPETRLHQLQQLFHANTVRNLFLVKELLMLLSLLEEQGIPAVPYKGPVLAASVYGSFALRQSGDLDILIHETDAVRAKDLLISQGYRLQYQPSAAYEALFRRLRQTYDLVRKDDQVLVELHWNVISWPIFFPPSSAFLWERLGSISVADIAVRNLAPEDTLPVLCLHGTKHYWERLSWICDVAELIRAYPGINWERVMEQASRLGGSRPLFLGLMLARTLLGAAVPEPVLRELQADRVIPSLAKRVRLRLFDGADGLLWTIEQHLSYLRLEKRVQDKLRCGIYLAYRLIARLIYYVITPRVWRPHGSQ